MIAVPTLHPAFLLRSSEGDQGQSKFKQTVIADFKRALEYNSRIPQWDESAIWQRTPGGRLTTCFPTLQEVNDFVLRAAGTLIAVDIETTGDQPLASQILCVGIASSNGSVMCVPFLRKGGARYWESANEEAQAFGLLAWLLAHQETPKTFHNGSFDTVVLWKHGFKVANWSQDSLLLHHCIDGEMPHSLAYVASRYLEVPYWKDEVKGDVRWIDMNEETLRTYNLRDCLTTLRVLYPMWEEAYSYNVLHLYQEELQLAKIMCHATIRGLEVDLQRRDDPTLEEVIVREHGVDLKRQLPKGLGPRLRIQQAEALDALQQIAGNSLFKPGSPIQLRWLLFEHLKFPIVARTKKGAPATDKTAMVLLALNANTRAQKVALRALARFRKASKFLGTWINGLPILSDNRLHVSWKLHTVTGRFASSPNAQNWSRAIKRIFKAGKDQVFCSIDLNQAELRGVAYIANDQELLKMYERGINVHTANACLLFQTKCPVPKDTNVQTEEYLREACWRILGLSYDEFPTLPASQWKSTRTLAKNFVFGDIYKAEAKTLFEVIRAKRDPETDEILFPDIELGEIEGTKIIWEQAHPAITSWWTKIDNFVRKQGYYQCPLSGRIRWYRAGFKVNEIVNFPIQTLVAGHMNKTTIRVDAALKNETRGTTEIVQQVHDALTTEGPEEYREITCQILQDCALSSFELSGFPRAQLPPDAPTFGYHLDEV